MNRMQAAEVLYSLMKQEIADLKMEIRRDEIVFYRPFKSKIFNMLGFYQEKLSLKTLKNSSIVSWLNGFWNAITFSDGKA